MDKEEKKTASEKFSAWLVKYRFVLIGVIGGIIVCAAIIGVILAVDESNREKGFAALDQIETEYSEMIADSELSADVRADKIATFRDELAGLTKKGAVGSRAYMMLADVEFNEGNWDAAIAAWNNSVEANPEAYTTPLAWYNIAIAYEEAGDIDNAIAYLRKTVEAKDFPLKSRALFNAGRLEEVRGNYEEAVDWYTQTNDDFSGDSWANFAMSRIITLEAEGKVNN